MGRRSHALIAFTSALIAVIAAVTLVVVDLENWPAGSSSSPTTQSTPSGGVSPSSEPPSTQPSAGQKPQAEPAPATEPNTDSDDGERSPGSSATPEDLVDLIPQGMTSYDMTCQVISGGVTCGGQGMHNITVESVAAYQCDPRVCTDITDQGDASVESAYLFEETYRQIVWVPAAYPDYQIRVTADMPESAEDFVTWWQDHL